MKNKINIIIKDVRKGVPKSMKPLNVYVKYLKSAGDRGQLTMDDVTFWSRVNLKMKENPLFNPYGYIYRQKYRTGLRANQFTFGKKN